MHDTIHEQEQQHLSETYAKLLDIHARLKRELASLREEAAESIGDMQQDLSRDEEGDIHVESMAELMSFTAAVDAYSLTADSTATELKRNELLLEQPYFAKVRIKLAKSGRVHDVYLGSAGATDESQHHFIVDWRSPVAEVYYNQANGPTSYVANGRTIEVDLQLRRQFDIHRDVLNACFDTTVAIEDPLLLRALAKQHSEKLGAITATIQKEQNEVVRHEDVDVLLVNGIAGSGKTSVLLQRIAYLFYQQRDSLDASQVYLFSPNAVFESYIDAVLPDMGEKNPNILTWKGFLERAGAGGRGAGLDTSVQTLETLEAGMEDLKLGARDFADIRIGERTLVKARSVQAAVKKHERLGIGPRLISIVSDDLHARLDTRIGQIARDEHFQEEVLLLDEAQQIAAFGETIVLGADPEKGEEQELLEYAQAYAQHLYGPAHELIDNVAWLRIDRIGMRMLGTESLGAVEWLYLYVLLTAHTAHKARYVMIDEAQDYTQAQLMLLERYFEHAHFLLLGDEHQAIYEHSSSFADIRELFAARRTRVEECRLMTSYRSSPEITELFCSLLDEDERGLTSSVQHAGVAPDIEAYENADIHRNVLRSVVRKARDEYTLSAIITSDRGILKWVTEFAGDDVVLIHDGQSLPARGVVALDLALAKGLEFDQVIIPDAQANTYPDTPLARRRLYTAISRATHKVTLLACGTLSPLLAG